MSSEQLPDPTYPFSPDGRDSASQAYVIVPAGHDPASYVRQALDTGRISVVTDRGEFLHRVVVARHVLSEINQLGWPSDVGLLGPSVLLVTLPIHNQPVAVGTLLGGGEISGHASPYEQGLLLRGPAGTYVALRARGDAGSLALTLDGEGEQTAQLTVRLTHPEAGARHDTLVQGDTVHRTDGRHRLDAGQQLTLRVGPQGSQDDTQGQMELTYARGQGLRYADEYGNEILATKDHVVVHRAGQGHRRLALTEQGINLGSDQAAEPALLGNTLLDLVREAIDLILQASWQTALGGPVIAGPINTAAFLNLKARLDTARSQHVRLD